jgi:hypothetical protein
VEILSAVERRGFSLKSNSRLANRAFTLMALLDGWIVATVRLPSKVGNNLGTIAAEYPHKP